MEKIKLPEEEKNKNYSWTSKIQTTVSYSTPVSWHFENKHDEIEYWMRSWEVTPDRYQIHDDNTVTVKSKWVKIENEKFTQLPVVFRAAYCNFTIDNTPLTSLLGVPKKIYGNFDISRTQITTLENGPEFVRDNYWVGRNKLESLKGSPSVVNRLYCAMNKLTTFEHGPIQVNYLYAFDNPLKTLDYAPIVTNDVEFLSDNEDCKLPPKMESGFKYLLQQKLWNPELTYVQNILNVYKDRPQILQRVWISPELDRALPPHLSLGAEMNLFE